MSEDIKILEDFIDGFKKIDENTLEEVKPTQFGEGQRYVYSDVYYAIENLLKRNKELEEYKKIAELTKISCCTAQNCEALNNAIKNSLENMNLKERMIQLEEENKLLNSKILDAYDRGWILKSVIKEKIEELRENGYWEFNTDRDLEKTIEVLEELLGKEDK
jgi:L-lactate utilization protein LutC